MICCPSSEGLNGSSSAAITCVLTVLYANASCSPPCAPSVGSETSLPRGLGAVGSETGRCQALVMPADAKSS